MGKREKRVLAGRYFKFGDRGVGSRPPPFGKWRGEDISFPLRRARDPYGGAPTGGPTKGGTNGRRKQKNNYRGGVFCGALPGPEGPRPGPRPEIEARGGARRVDPGGIFGRGGILPTGGGNSGLFDSVGGVWKRGGICGKGAVHLWGHRGG